jgi:hypothetical protein
MNLDRYIESLFGHPRACQRFGRRCHICAVTPPEPECWRCGEHATAYKIWFRVLEEAVWDHACDEHSTKLTLAT